MLTVRHTSTTSYREDTHALKHTLRPLPLLRVVHQSRTTAEEAIKTLADQFPSHQVTRKGYKWTFLPGALAEGTMIQIRTRGNKATLDLIYVESEHRQKGAARTAINILLSHLDNFEGGEGVEINLVVGATPLHSHDHGKIPHDETLVRFYRSFGFVQMTYTEDGSPVMVREAVRIKPF